MPPKRRRASTDSQDSAAALCRDERNAFTASPEEENIAQWREIFSFTTNAHLQCLILGITCSILAGGAAPATAILSGKIFEGFTEYAAGAWTKEKLYDNGTRYILLLVAVAGAKWLVDSLVFMLWMSFGEMQAEAARDSLFYEMLEKDLEWYDLRKNGIDALIPRLQAQIFDLQLATAQPLGSTVQLICQAVLQLAQAFYYSWDLTLVVFGTVPFMVIAVTYFGRRMQAALDMQQEILAGGQKHVTGALKAIETVKCYNGQGVESGKYCRILHLAAISYRRVAKFAALEMAFVVLLSMFMFAQGFYYGGILVARGNITSGDVVTTFLSAMGAFQALQNILPQMIVLEKGRTAGSHLTAIMKDVINGSNMRNSERLLSPLVCKGLIDIRGLTFAYPLQPEQLVLQDVTMSIPAGKMAFLIGRSGSGKSTIGQLLLRFYAGSSGVYIDGVSLDTLDPIWLRSNITLVEQESVLFNDTVFQNIAMGRPTGSTEAEADEAIEFALLRDMVSDMPDGLHTTLGYNGATVSGGQRQRIALARARLRDTPILILDESTSALDHRKRSLVMDTIRLWRHGKTTIIITHDISQIEQDDYLFLLVHGRMVEEGYRKHLDQSQYSHFQAFVSERDPRSCQSRGTSRGHYDALIHPRPRSLDLIDVPAPQKHRLSGLKNVQYQKTQDTDAVYMSATKSPSCSRLSDERFDMASGSDADTWPALPLRRNLASATTLLPDIEQLPCRSHNDSAATPRNRHDRSRYHHATSSLNSCNEATASTMLHTTQISQRVRKVSYTGIIATVWPHLDLPGKFRLLLGFWGATVHAVVTPVFSYILAKLMVTYSTPQDSRREAFMYLIAILGLGLLDSLHTYMFRYCFESVAQRWVDSICSEAYTRILTQPQEFFEQEENSASQLTNCLRHNAEEMRNILGRFVPLMYIATVITVLSTTWALYTQWKLTVVAICMAPCMVLGTRMLLSVSRKWQTLSNDASETTFSIFSETHTKIKTVRALLLESHFSKKFKAASNHALNIGFKRSIYTGILYGASTSIGALITSAVFYVGTYLAITPSCAPAILQVIVMLTIAIQVVSEILEYIPQIGNAQDTASRLLRLARLARDSPESWGRTNLRAVQNLAMNSLSFSYPTRPEQTALFNVNLDIRPGQLTAIVGGSGSGKSTIINLLLRLYNTPSETSLVVGRPHDLTIAGRDVKDFDISSLRSLIVPVFQKTTLFPITVAENISYGLDASSLCNSPTAIRKAAKRAGIHNFIRSLPYGYETMLGDGGISVSGGQAQRIAIARALVRQPAVLVLDEATSALDVQSAAVIRTTIRQLVDDPARPMTVVMVTHNRDMMEVADNVIVLERGTVVETGGFRELLAKNGALANLLNGHGEAGTEVFGQEYPPRETKATSSEDVIWEAMDMPHARLGM